MARRRFTVCCLSLTLALAAFGAGAAPVHAGKDKGRSREISLDYSAPAAGVMAPKLDIAEASCELPEAAQGCLPIPLDRRDRFLSLSVTDASGQRGGGYVTDSRSEVIAYFCGSADKIPVYTSEVTVVLVNGICEDGAPALATSGTVTVVLTNR